MENIYNGLDKLLRMQNVLEQMSSSDLENLSNISGASTRAIRMYDQMIKIEDGVDDHHDGEGDEELFGHVSLITRTAVTEARALLPSLRGPHSGRLEMADTHDLQTTENASGGGLEGTLAGWPRATTHPPLPAIVPSTFPIFTNDEYQRYSRHQMSFLDPLSTVPFILMGTFLALTRACLFVNPFGVNAYISAGVVFTMSNMIAFSFFLTCFIATKYYESHTAQYKYAAEVIKRHYAFIQHFSMITAALSTGFVAYGRVKAGTCKNPDDYYGNQICNPWADSKGMPMDSASFVYLLPFLVQVMFKTVRVEVAFTSWLIATSFIVLSLQHVGSMARDMWYPVFSVFFLFAAFEMERHQRIYYLFHNQVC